MLLYLIIELSLLGYIRRWLRGPQWNQTELDSNLALPLIDSVTLGKFLKILRILLLLLKPVVTVMSISGIFREVREIVYVTCSLQGLAWERLGKCEVITIKTFLVFIVIVVITHLPKLYY